jgi:hypothetical protein
MPFNFKPARLPKKKLDPNSLPAKSWFTLVVWNITPKKYNTTTYCTWESENYYGSFSDGFVKKMIDEFGIHELEDPSKRFTVYGRVDYDSNKKRNYIKWFVDGSKL